MATCILEQIAQNLKARLDALVTAGLASASLRPRRSGVPQSLGDKVLVLFQDDPQEDTEGPVGRKQWVQPFAVVCCVKPSDASTAAVDTAVNDLRAQVEKKLREDPLCGGLAVDTRIRPPVAFLLGEGEEGVIVNCDVIYRTLEDDPYTQG